MTYYVYEYIRLDTNEVFYVGKGKNGRYKTLNNRNPMFLNIVKSAPYKVIKVLENLSNEDALEAEMSFIKYRKSLGQASCNLTSGGQGAIGYKHTLESRKLMQCNLGRKLSEDTKAKMRESSKARGPHSEITKEKIRQNHILRGIKPPNRKGAKFKLTEEQLKARKNRKYGT